MLSDFQHFGGLSTHSLCMRWTHQGDKTFVLSIKGFPKSYKVDNIGNKDLQG